MRLTSCCLPFVSVFLHMCTSNCTHLVVKFCTLQLSSNFYLSRNLSWCRARVSFFTYSIALLVQFYWTIHSTSMYISVYIYALRCPLNLIYSVWFLLAYIHMIDDTALYSIYVSTLWPICSDGGTGRGGEGRGGPPHHSAKLHYIYVWIDTFCKGFHQPFCCVGGSATSQRLRTTYFSVQFTVFSPSNLFDWNFSASEDQWPVSIYWTSRSSSYFSN
jgi:hypothetical protein